MFDIHAIHAAAYSIAVDGENFRFHDANASSLALSGHSAFQPGLTPHDIFPPDVAAEIVQRYRACSVDGAVSYASSAMVGAELRRWQTTLFSVAGDDGRPAFLYGVCSRLEEAATADLPTLALDTLDGGFWTLDLATREFKTSRGLAEKIAGPGRASLNLAEYVSHVHVDDLDLEMPDGDQDATVEFRVFTHERRTRWLQTRRRPVRDASGRPTHVVGIVLDVTERKLEMMRLAQEAATDLLTRVGNRRAFERAAERCFADEAEPFFGVIAIDLDHFKPVNDCHGHRVGDELLREVGRRLAALVAPGECLARVGGDEFSVLLPATTLERMDVLVARIEAAFFEPFAFVGAAIVVGASCGSAMRLPCDRSVGDIVARADRALYAAKGRRRRLIA